MRLVCCSHWPTWSCSVIQTFFPTCSCLNCHAQRVTVLTSTHLSPYTAWTLQWMWTGGNFSSVKNSITSRYLNRTSSHPSISTGTEKELWIALGSRLRMVRGRYPIESMEPVLSSFLYSNKNYDREGKTFSARPHIWRKWNSRMQTGFIEHFSSG